jgi:hypothetical protein
MKSYVEIHPYSKEFGNNLNDRVKAMFDAGLDGNAMTLLDKIQTGIRKAVSDFKTDLDQQTEKLTFGDEVEFNHREWLKILRSLEIAVGDSYTGKTILQMEVTKTISDIYEHEDIVIGQRD